MLWKKERDHKNNPRIYTRGKIGFQKKSIPNMRKPCDSDHSRTKVSTIKVAIHERVKFKLKPPNANAAPKNLTAIG